MGGDELEVGFSCGVNVGRRSLSVLGNLEYSDISGVWMKLGVIWNSGYFDDFM